MSGRRRLLVQPQNRRRTASGDGPQEEGAGAAELRPIEVNENDVPPYEPLELPLDDKAMRQVFEVTGSRALTRGYDAHLKKSAEMLREAVGAVNDLYADRKADMQRMVDRRRDRDVSQPTPAEIETGKILATMGETVPTLTRDIERSARVTIDLQVELEDEHDALAWTALQIQERHEENRRRRQQLEQEAAQRAEADTVEAEAAGAGSMPGAWDDGEEEDDGEDGTAGGGRRRGGGGKKRKAKKRKDEGGAEEEEEGGEEEEEQMGREESPAVPPPTSVVSLLKEARENRAAAYAEMDAHRKYGLNNDYIAFKQTWHDAVYPDGDVALPDATSWFDSAGRPAAYGPLTALTAVEGGASAGEAGGEAGGANGESGGSGSQDQDLIVAREVISFKCPLTLVVMTDPYKSRVCNHTFEKRGILEYLQQGPKPCPQTGCSRTIRKSDLIPDTIMQRRILRAQINEERLQANGATSDIEPEDVDEYNNNNNNENENSPNRSLFESQARSVKRERMARLSQGP